MACLLVSASVFGQDLYVRWASHWSDEDHDCQDTRQEVLIEESLVPVTFKTEKNCKVATGRWYSAYTNSYIDGSPSLLDIDHLVPLKEAYQSGGWEWSKEKKEKYYNYLRSPHHLIAVDRSSNRSKGARSPDKWLPPNKKHHCRYAVEWMMIKMEWELAFRDEEKEALKEILIKCLATPDSIRQELELTDTNLEEDEIEETQ